MCAKGQKQENINKIAEVDLQRYLAAMETKTEQYTKEHNKNIEQVTDQNATLLSLVQEHQKKIEDLILQSKILMEAMTKKTTPGTSGGLVVQPLEGNEQTYQQQLFHVGSKSRQTYTVTHQQHGK